MRSVLICAPDPLVDELHGTLLWREGIERHLATSVEDALIIAVAARPNLIAIDNDLPRTTQLVRTLRQDASTRAASIALIARGELALDELELLQAGANAILRFPPGPDWDARLSTLLNVAVRRKTRVPVQLELEGSTGEIERLSGTVLNLSVSGMLLACEVELAVGTDLDFALMHERSMQPVTGCGHVVRRDPSGHVGVQFYGLEGDGLERIRAFVEA